MSERVTGLGPGSEVVDAAKGALLPVAFEDLVAWYPFRSGTGEDLTAGDSRFGDTTDYSAVVNGATFQASGGTTDIQTGANSGAFEFDGTDDSMNTGFAERASSFTLMAFVNLDVTGRSTVLANEKRRAGDGIIFGVSSGGLEISNFSSYGFRDGIGNISTGTFTHIAMTSETKGYINGNQVATEPQGPLPNPRGFLIGNFVDGSAFFDGIIDDVRIYNAALSQSQINQIYLNTKP